MTMKLGYFWCCPKCLSRIWEGADFALIAGKVCATSIAVCGLGGRNIRFGPGADVRE